MSLAVSTSWEFTLEPAVGIIIGVAIGLVVLWLLGRLRRQ